MYSSCRALQLILLGKYAVFSFLIAVDPLIYTKQLCHLEMPEKFEKPIK